MSEQVIKLSQNAAERIKEIMSKAEDKTGVRVGVKTGGCPVCLMLWNMQKMSNLMRK